ncbi:MAG: response regulator transcription factor [Bacteroidota bacterium]
MNCIIIDDEPLALGIIKSYCEDTGGINVLGTFTNPLKSIHYIQKNPVDLVFLDIEMPQISGIEFIKSLEKKPLFIFTTAYPQYAIEGFELNAIDYLVKPIPFPRFLKSMNRAKEIYHMKVNKEAIGNVAPAGGGTHTENHFVFVKSDYNNVKIKIDDITYVQGLKDYLKIHVKEGKPILTLLSFREMAAKLPSTSFYRVHRSYLVNVNHVDSIQRNRILIHEVRIPIGESYKGDFMKRVGL